MRNMWFLEYHTVINQSEPNNIKPPRQNKQILDTHYRSEADDVVVTSLPSLSHTPTREPACHDPPSHAPTSVPRRR